VDKGLDAFGENVHAVVYYELKNSFGISRQEIPQKPELLVQTIDKIFGVGSAAVSRAIRTELESAFQIRGLRNKDLLSALKIAHREALATNG
jgi:hypothetical protein